MYTFAVITKVPEWDGTGESEGSLADDFIIPVKCNDPMVCGYKLCGKNVVWVQGGVTQAVYDDFIKKRDETPRWKAINIRTPVFTLGEILVLNECGREIGGHGRKPSKWWVEYEEFPTIEQAIKRAEEVMGA